jgi:DNA polymerase III subunit delta
MLYLVHGDDEFRRSEWLSNIRASVSDDSALAELNTSFYSGQKLALEEMEAAWGAGPFLAAKRLIVIEGMASRLQTKQSSVKGEAGRRAGRAGFDSQLAEGLRRIPATTDLVFSESQTLKATHALVTLIANLGGQVLELQPPRADSYELRRWATDRARHHAATISPDGIDCLVAYTGANLRMLDQELAKMAVFADGNVLGVEDVKALVSNAREANVFDMVDALGRRDVNAALRKVRELQADGEATGYLLFMVARQFRLLIQVRDQLDRGVPPGAVGSALDLHRYVAQKLLDQARNFSLAQLKSIHTRLVEVDWAVKTGKVEADAALDIFVTSLATR